MMGKISKFVSLSIGLCSIWGLRAQELSDYKGTWVSNRFQSISIESSNALILEKGFIYQPSDTIFCKSEANFSKSICKDLTRPFYTTTNNGFKQRQISYRAIDDQSNSGKWTSCLFNADTVRINFNQDSIGIDFSLAHGLHPSSPYQLEGDTVWYFPIEKSNNLNWLSLDSISFEELTIYTNGSYSLNTDLKIKGRLSKPDFDHLKSIFKQSQFLFNHFSTLVPHDGRSVVLKIHTKEDSYQYVGSQNYFPKCWQALAAFLDSLFISRKHFILKTDKGFIDTYNTNHLYWYNENPIDFKDIPASSTWSGPVRNKTFILGDSLDWHLCPFDTVIYVNDLKFGETRFNGSREVSEPPLAKDKYRKYLIKDIKKRFCK